MPQQSSICTVSGCDKPVLIKMHGLCCNHYQLALRTGAITPRVTGIPALTERYGESFVPDVLSLATVPLKTLRDVGEKYGLSRERIRQIYQEITGTSYTTTLKAKSKQVRDDMRQIGCRYDPRQKVALRGGPRKSSRLDAQLFIFNKAKSLGYDVTPLPGPKAAIEINGHKVLISAKGSASSTGFNKSKTRYFHYHLYPYHRNFDFVAVHLCRQEVTYLFPMWSLKSRSEIYIPESALLAPEGMDGMARQIAPFREAWGLLERDGAKESLEAKQAR